MTPTLYMMIGPPGCGKTYFAAKLHHSNGAKIVSSDDIRKELYGDETIQKNNHMVFDIAHKRILKELQEGRSVIFDATNVTQDNRDNFLRKVKGLNRLIYICGLVYGGTLTECLQQNSNRNRTVPEDVVRKMWTQLRTRPPMLSDGFDALVALDEKGIMLVKGAI